jgi:hypothetical protein
VSRGLEDIANKVPEKFPAARPAGYAVDVHKHPIKQKPKKLGSVELGLFFAMIKRTTLYLIDDYTVVRLTSMAFASTTTSSMSISLEIDHEFVPPSVENLFPHRLMNDLAGEDLFSG